MRSPLLVLAIHHLRNRPFRTGLTIVGVAVGISAAIAMRLSNTEVLRSFEQSVSTVTGNVSVQISGGNFEVDERWITKVRQLPGIRQASPVIQKVAVIPTGSQKGKAFSLWGLDLLDVAIMNDVQLDVQDEQDLLLEDFLSPQALFLGTSLATELSVEVGDSLTMSVDDRLINFVVRGIVRESDQMTSRWDNMGFVDIATAQLLFNMVERLDRIDLVTESDYDVDQIVESVRHVLQAEANVGRPSQRNQQVERMIHTFQFNLGTLSTVGLFVGVFLVYNAVSFSVVQYRREIGILRAMGMSRKQISLLYLGEAGIIGFVGGVLGSGLGALLSEHFLSLVSSNVSELYTSVSVKGIQMPLAFYGVGGLLGMGIALLGAMNPCWDAATTSPSRALAPGGYEESQTQHLGKALGFAVGLFFLAGVLTIPESIEGIPVWGYGSAFCLLLACSFLGPVMLQALKIIMKTKCRGQTGMLSRLAADQMIKTPGRNSVALSVLMVGLALIVGVGTMVQSFRDTVEIWIDQTLMANLIVTPFSWLGGQEEGGQMNGLPLSLIPKVKTIPGVAEVDPYYQVPSTVAGRNISLVARDFSIHARRSQYLFMDGRSDEILTRSRDKGGVIISEVLSHDLGVKKGDSITLSTPGGNTLFPVLGVFYDYAIDGGKVVMDRSLYHQFWGKSGATVLAVYVDDGVNSSLVGERLEQILQSEWPVVIISNKELRSEILDIFDRTFRVTYGLEFIAMVVAILGIINTLVTSIMERQRELSTFRAVGAGGEQIQQLVFWESLYLGSLGAVLGLLGGLLLAVLLIEVINKQSFGWTIHFTLPWKILGQAGGIGILAVLLAGVFPARWAVRQSIGEGLRCE